MSERGTIVVDRGIFGHPVFADEPFTEREAWLWLIAQAAFKAHERRVGRTRVKLERGQLAHATRFMAEAWGWSQSTIRRFLAKLAAEGMISITDGAQVTQITICNYDTYQRVNDSDGSEPARSRLKEEETEVKKDDREDARAREASTGVAISPEAHALSDDFLTAIGVDPRNPELYGMSGAPYVAAVWIARGYDRALILATAADVAARYGPNKPLKYWTACFETAHRKRPNTLEPQLPLLSTAGGSDETTGQRRRDQFGRKSRGLAAYALDQLAS